jgi:hypothetical protein
MRGADRARTAELEFRRDMALLTAYFAGAGAYQHIDPKKALSWADFHTRITSPPRRTSNAELIAFFARHAESAEPPDEQDAQ